jgi:Holliday junction resolvase RusA-like endonuclease
MIQLTLPLPPLGNRYKGFDRRRGHWYVTDAATHYKRTVAGHALAAGLRDLISESVTLSVIVYRARAAGDIDGYQKVLFDALEGAVIVDDKQIRKLCIEIDDTQRKNPRVEVQLARLVTSAPAPRRKVAL